ncbi:uncharacterized protein K444DRAFT_666200 [Hyaloscypha bicolor E]|uniref:Nephrocystin 3-like N-terminal domain-containing protein n=1 Tax=Hyaloscypha bicolor E TaxID=1095630 RepID=A0A2J6T0Z8_9HELO|nr:uncharacterized protein K444DRAFT_666200 [Hyaloscypha bicolor E]PMD56613.1 hypothetical protein K444DRAFT_666200 [Hyaloscypha bicolor E]
MGKVSPPRKAVPPSKDSKGLQVGVKVRKIIEKLSVLKIIRPGKPKPTDEGTALPGAELSAHDVSEDGSDFTTRHVTEIPVRKLPADDEDIVADPHSVATAEQEIPAQGSTYIDRANATSPRIVELEIANHDLDSGKSSNLSDVPGNLRTNTTANRASTSDISNIYPKEAESSDPGPISLHSISDRKAASSFPSEEETRSLWGKACENVEARKEQSKYLHCLQKSAQNPNGSGVTSDLAQILSERQKKSQAENEVSESSANSAISRALRSMSIAKVRSVRFLMSTKDLAMGLARLDPHGIAPIVLGGVYTVVSVFDNNTEECQAALTITLELAGIVAVWTGVENHQISKNSDQRLNKLYAKLSDQIVGLYEDIIVLFGTILTWLDRNQVRKIIGGVVPAQTEWKNSHAKIKSLETNCNNVRSEITMKKESHDKSSEILRWISEYDIRGSYQNILEKTGVLEKYSDHGQWLIDHKDFQEWSSSGASSVLWLRGIMGTGKTTLVARAVQQLKRSATVEIFGSRLAIFFFRKTAGASITSVTVETCLSSILRQLSWDKTIEELDPSIKSEYYKFKAEDSNDTCLTIGECRQLLSRLIGLRETYIMIDAIDECEDPYGLLKELQKLLDLIQDAKAVSKPLHVMLASRDDLTIDDFFKGCRKIATNPEDAKQDQEEYINREIDSICRTLRASKFATSPNGHSERLKELLKEKGGGSFRWIEIQLEFFGKTSFKTSDEITVHLNNLQSHTKHQTLYDEYERLFWLLQRSGPNLERALKMFRLMACSNIEMTASDLAEAINTSEPLVEELSPDNIRRILVGFVTEPSRSGSREYCGKALDGLVFQWAHASVLEFLMERASSINFTVLAQHSEAASLCFSRIKACDDHPVVPPPQEMSIFLKYSLLEWPEHCKQAFKEDPNCSLVEKTKKFILADSYRIWNRLAPSLITWGNHYHFSGLCCDRPSAMPGFVIVDFELSELLRLADIQALIDLQQCNLTGRTLLQFWIGRTVRAPKMIDQLVDLFPAQIKGTNGGRELFEAIYMGSARVVAKLLENGEKLLQGQRSTLGVAVVRMLFVRRLEKNTETRKNRLEIIRILLAKRFTIFDLHLDFEEGDKFLRPVMSMAVRSNYDNLINIFIETIVDFDKRGLTGSVQRLLRTRDIFGQTPIEAAQSPLKERLSQILGDTTHRDGRILFEFDETEVMKEMKCDVEQWTNFKKNLAHGGLAEVCSKNSRGQHWHYDEGKRYEEWLLSRYKEVDQEYRELNRQLLKEIT